MGLQMFTDTLDTHLATDIDTYMLSPTVLRMNYFRMSLLVGHLTLLGKYRVLEKTKVI